MNTKQNRLRLYGIYFDGILWDTFEMLPEDFQRMHLQTNYSEQNEALREDWEQYSGKNVATVTFAELCQEE